MIQVFKKIKTFTLIAFLTFSLFATTIVGVQAQEKASEKLGKVGQAAGFGSASFPFVIGNIIKGILSLIGILFLSYMIYAGYLWLTASGDEEKIKKAKKIISGSIIGFVVTMSAYAITAFVVSRFTTTGIYESGPAQTTPSLNSDGCESGYTLINNECTFIGGDPSE